MPNAQALEEGVYRFLHKGRRAAGAGVPDAQRVNPRLITPSGWRDGPQIELAVHVMRSGPDVRLVHGWRGEAMDIHPLALRLVAGGHRVWLPDLPGHCQSGGAHLSPPLAAAALQAVQEPAGSFRFAAGHSYGGATLVHGLLQGLHVQRIALLAPVTHYGYFARRTVSQSGLPEAMWPAWLQRLAATTGVDPEAVNLRDQAPHIAIPALVALSSDDDIVPRRALEPAIASWPGVRWLPLDGQGHRGLLTDQAALDTMCRFASLP